MQSYRKVPGRAIRMIKRFEGFRALCYDDKQPNIAHPERVIGTPTWGYGDTCTAGGMKLKDSDVGVKSITKASASIMLTRRVDNLALTMARKCTMKSVSKLSDNQYAALLCFFYNTGFRTAATVVRLIKQGRFAEAPKHMSLYVNSGGVRMRGLVKRRRAEVDLYLLQSTSAVCDTAAAPEQAHHMKPVMKSRTFLTSSLACLSAVAAGAMHALPILQQYGSASPTLNTTITVLTGVAAASAFASGVFRTNDIRRDHVI